MTVPIGPALRWSTSRHLLVVAALGAWVATVRWAHTMGNGPGTMGLGWAEFVGVWAVMMAAMMLPTVWHETPDHFVAGEPANRVILFAVGYLWLWAMAGIAAFALATGAARLTADSPGAATICAAALLATCGIYQLTPLKSRALAHCRLGSEHPEAMPGLGGASALRQGVRHGGWCLGSSWAAMALLVAFGMMNIVAMAVLFVAIYAERTRFHGGGFTRLTGLASLAFAPLVLVYPQLAPGLHHAMLPMRM